MKLVVGLGNPGKIYRDTRHNLGYKVVEELSKRFNTDFRKRKFKAKIAEFEMEEEKIYLVKPLTFMNLSGEVVKEVLKYLKAEVKDLLVISDDINLPLGKIRIRQKGTSGGHKGIQSIIENIGDKFARLRIGTGKPLEEESYTEFVLGKFKKEEREIINQAMKKAADAVEVYLKKGITSSMNKYNFDE